MEPLQVVQSVESPGGHVFQVARVHFQLDEVRQVLEHVVVQMRTQARVVAQGKLPKLANGSEYNMQTFLIDK